MRAQYSSQDSRNYRVIAALVGGPTIPNLLRCDAAVTMDPEIDAPVLVIPFKYNAGDFEGQDAEASWSAIQSYLPELADSDCSFGCTRILDLLVVKVYRASAFSSHPSYVPAFALSAN